MALITVITPTYNRGNRLYELFSSLQNQTDYDFEWMIVDDGSSDNTEAIVRGFTAQAKYTIQYLKKENGGKHTALNFGIPQILTDLTIIVDSDDTLLPDAVTTIKEYYAKYKERIEIGVFSFLRENSQHNILVKAPRDEFVGSYVKERIRGNLPGDMAEVFLTKALREFPFPEFQGEKFMSEDVVWIPLGMKYQTLFVNKVIYRCEYLEDGLTQNDKRHKFASPFGSMMRGKMLMNKECGLKARVKGAIIYNCFGKEVKQNIPKQLELQCIEDKILLKLTVLPGIFYNRKWKKITNG